MNDMRSKTAQMNIEQYIMGGNMVNQLLLARRTEWPQCVYLF